MAKLRRINLGRKDTGATCIAEKPKNKVHYPSFCIYDKKLPIEPEDVGKILTATIKLKVTGVNMRTDEDKQSLNYDFDVREIVFNTKGTSYET